jgi:hypothetical protein
LSCNVVVVAAVSLVTPAQRGGFHEHSRASMQIAP